MTDVNIGDAVEVLDPRLSPTVRQLRSSVYIVGLPSVQYEGVCVSLRCSSSCIHVFLMIGCVRSFSLLTGLPWYGSKEFSTLQKLLWFGPSCRVISLYPFPQGFRRVRQRYHSISSTQSQSLCPLGSTSVQGLSSV